jgi:uncharacterized repeat protein (TIGR03803 family)
MSGTRFEEVTGMPAPSAHIRFRERTGSLRAGLILLLLVAATGVTSPAQTFKTLYNFCSKTGEGGYCLDGAGPLYTTLVQGANGDLYGTTVGGGINDYGTVFKITTAGKLKTIYNFCSQPSCADGFQPEAGLVLANDGSFYGEVGQGGAYGGGTVFKITAAGKLTTLYNFCSLPSCADGSGPAGSLIQATDGNFYGTTSAGGTYSAGTAFEVISGKKGIILKTLHSFSGDDGLNPETGLIQATDGNFYGTASAGSAGVEGCSPTGGGTFFQLTPSGTFTTLSGFCAPNGFYVDSAPVQAGNGDLNFYGTTTEGGDGNNDGYGTVYEMAVSGMPPIGSLTSLYSFCLQTGCPDGEYPQAVNLGTDGNFYGTTYSGGANSDGTVFKITPTRQFTTLHSFTGTDGIYPNGALLLDTNGTFYGTTYEGGKNGQSGTIFSLTTGLGPFVKTIPTSGKAKTKVTILGTSLTGTTAVSFNGTAAVFKVVSSSEIKTTVPAGATSGTVTVTTSGGTLSSCVAFQIP